MDIGFMETFDAQSSEYRKIDTYDPLLPNLCSCYVKDYFDGFLCVYKDKHTGFDDLLQYFIRARSIKLNFAIGKIRFNKRMDSCICLLINPYFDEFCDYIEKNIYTMNRTKLFFLKRQVFEKLADETYKVILNKFEMRGSKFYQKKNCYEKSKRMLELINGFLKQKMVSL